MERRLVDWKALLLILLSMIMTLKLDASLKKNDMMSWMSFKIY